MAITNGYATLVEIKARLGIVTGDTADDTKLESVVEGISRAIDNHCGRRFYLDGSDATRYFTPEFADLLYVGDLVSVTSLFTDEDGDRTYERTWAATDYDLEPFNAALDSWPYTTILTTPKGLYTFPVGISKGVKMVSKWGWPAVPKPIAEACLLAGEKLFKRKDAIFGVVGSPEMGVLKQMMRDDPDLAILLEPYVWFDIGGV